MTNGRDRRENQQKNVIRTFVQSEHREVSGIKKTGWNLSSSIKIINVLRDKGQAITLCL